ncbi:salicylate hydroxylase [Hoeflea marina]|uniref:Salicylate hydroxylase n=1 Tax=Hoeflea marina TaxID=274592 RepID=A0A317PWY1_9HYPH|nr:FAD-dependent monooxygenase [Hoeflea marina]PWW04000.1 salicylate hydroxylase [Hoeflea marina]
MATLPITIIGAGIGGLTAALAFARKGHGVEIVEQAAELSEVGAGLQVSPNASRVLGALGLSEALAGAMHCPGRIDLRDGRTLSPIAHVPAGDWARNRWGAPYGVMHRADLHKVLTDAVIRHPKCRLHIGRRFSSGPDESVTDALAVITGGRPQLVVGADGVWSAVRHRVPGALPPVFAGQVAWRFVVDASCAAPVLDAANVTAFLGPSTHLVAYPLDHGRRINMVAIAEGSDPGRIWDGRERSNDRAALLDAFRRWHPAISALLRAAPQMTCWPLYAVPDGRWSDGDRLVLIGDAAHAMTPFAAQGAAMAIEDGFELAEAVGAGDLPLGPILTAFESRRRIRLARARSRAAFNRFAYHARGPIRLGRNLVLALKSPESLGADLDWLYGHRSPGS